MASLILSSPGKKGFFCPRRELSSYCNGLFSIQFRTDRMTPPPPSLKEPPSELTAGAPELDVLLTVHLQVCKALLQVSRARLGWCPLGWACWAAEAWRREGLTV